MKEPKWVLMQTVIAIHQRQIAEHGGLEGIRDQPLLESALKAPQNLYYYGNPKPSLADLAACYAYSLTRNHPFRDGNKRISLVTCELFLQINGMFVLATQVEKYQQYYALADKTLSQKQFVEWLEACLLVAAEN
jgi:death-on-curing protein